MTDSDEAKQREETLANATAGLEELKLLDGGLLTKIEDLEKNIVYRRFYIPGGPPKKLLPGKGTETDTVKYDGITGTRDVFEKWDPRYIDDYIQQARQKAFHKRFLYFDGDDIRAASFASASNELKVVDFTTGLYMGDKNDSVRTRRVYGLISGIQYFDKLTLFTKDYADQLGITTAGWKKAILNADNIVKTATNHLQDFIGYTADEFKNYDNGFMVGSDRKDLWFADDLMDEWTELQEKYTEYKNRIWEILQNTNALNLCSNRVSGVFVGDAPITQSLNCIQQIGDQIEEIKKEEAANPEPTSTSSAAKTAVPAAVPVAVPVVANSTASNIKIADPVLVTEPSVATDSSNTNTNSNLKEILIIIIVSVLGIVALTGTYFYISHRKKKNIKVSVKK
jgi:hypothetical protein